MKKLCNRDLNDRGIGRGPAVLVLGIGVLAEPDHVAGAAHAENRRGVFDAGSELATKIAHGVSTLRSSPIRLRPSARRVISLRVTTRPALRTSSSRIRNSASVSVMDSSPTFARRNPVSSAIEPCRSVSGASAGAPDFRPAQDRVDLAPPQLARVEGLRQVIVSAELQPMHAIGEIVARGQHRYRQIRIAAQPAQYIEAS